ncbi:chromosome-associated kinesin KIF4 [Episyrphus balteatus]|uniref:chromosome-associated kinesin KIF4 n=1 Tax=Episyrphus balteatus TaxID=286459 RepID=UPI002485AAED|nr:chromosome-associated kinesin KIF4 [Episyrphus balteatus]
MSADSDCVRVAIRIRPLVKTEIERGCQSTIERIPGQPQLTVNKTDGFTFNYVFDPNDSQDVLYKDAVYEMTDKLFKGYNVTILAYGQTGSGKTYTMGTTFDGNPNENMGVIPRAMTDIFQTIEKKSKEFDFKVTCSFMELYQEQLFDLLSSASREQSIIDMREDRNGIIMPGLTEQKVTTAKETTDCLMRGSSGRAVASTAMNEQSSRSHAIFTLTIQSSSKNEVKNVFSSKFHLVDLAGSERSKKTKATGDRFKEGVKINQGLLALGNVISALGTNQGSGYVGYRDSKLTRLLQDSLGGNSVTLMIACVSPADYNVGETLSTLRYADRARKIKNKPIVNQDPHAAEINHLKGIIQKLRMEILNKSCGVMSSSMEGSSSFEGFKKDTTSIPYNELMEKYRQLQVQFQNTLHDVADNEMRAHIAEAAYDKLKLKTEEVTQQVIELSDEMKEDNCPPEFVDHVKKLGSIRKLIEDLGIEFQKSHDEIEDNKRNRSILPLESDSEQCNEQSEVMQQHTEAFTSKQIDLNDQLRRINRELTLKEELHQRVAVNLTKFYTLDENIEEKYKDCENKIKALEAEKSDLVEKLKHVKENVSAKLAEERRKRLQALEQEITDMKRKNVQQAKLLKVREKESEKIKNLQNDIQAMKESKVKLIRAMRTESENFRQFKLSREKEVMQLKNKDRKMQNEMARKESLHNKQRNVLKRKCEEALAINKRLKDALERQKVAQSQRNKNKPNTNASKLEQITSRVDEELDIIGSLIDAEISLEQLMEDRTIISCRIKALTDANDTSNKEELAELDEALQLRNAQITDLQQKVVSTDIESRIKNITETIQSLPEARAILKHLFTALSDIRRDFSSKLQEQKTARESAEEKLELNEKQMQQFIKEHEEQVVRSESVYEGKIAVLLRELHNASKINHGQTTQELEERFKIQEEALNKIEDLREELEMYRELCNELEQKMSNKGNKKKIVKKIEEEFDTIEELSSSDEEVFDKDDPENDPDWKKTPHVKRIHRSRNSKDKSVELQESMVKSLNGTKRSSDGTIKCYCKSGCKGRCGCKSNQAYCSSKCKCGDACVNRKMPDSNDSDSFEEKENIKTEKIEDDLSETITLSKPTDLTSILQTPKMARLSELTFNVPSAKKKFFN